MRRFLLFILLTFTYLLVAQPPAGYYDSANGKSDAQLKTTLFNIISANYTERTYNELWTLFGSSDIKADGKVWDMYSHCSWTVSTSQCTGSDGPVCFCYNREHTIPQSWFNRLSPMVSDAFHIYPTDMKVNAQRADYPFGECTAGSSLTNGKGRLGNSTFSGYSGIVFEPVDEYKGDFARTYFYFATRYENIMLTIGGESFNKTKYPSFSNWSRELFLKWHRQDPVSQKEITRNNVIYTYQENRNPFIDHPELAEYIWGDKVGTSWVNTASVDNPESAVHFSFDSEAKTIKLNINNAPMRYSIISISGQVIKSGTTEPFKSISVSTIYDGLYFIKFESNQIKAIRKFIIQ